VGEQSGLVMPLAYDDAGNRKYLLELLASPGTRAHDTTKIIDRYELRMLQSLLADFLMIGHSETGSRALAEPKMEFFELSLNTLLQKIADVFNRYLIPRLVRMNGWPQELSPVLKHGEVRRTDLKELGEFLGLLNQAGMPLFPNAPLQTYLMETAKLPSAPPDEIQDALDERNPLLNPELMGDPAGDEGDEGDDDEEDAPPPRAKKKPTDEKKPTKAPAAKTLAEAIELAKGMKRNGRRVRGSGVILGKLEKLAAELGE
jgi:hypothetical protein